MGDFKRLLVWQKAHALALAVPPAAARMRGTAFRSLRSQMVRAAHSIPANIVEGSGQRSDGEFARFVRYALNSCNELEYHLILARDSRVLDQPASRTLLARTAEVHRMLTALLHRLARDAESRRVRPGSGLLS